MYQVWLEGVSIPRVMKVEVGNDRDVKEYNGIGKGKYTLADSRGIRTWAMKMEQVSPELFAFLEERLANKEESRLVIVSEAEKTSVLVLLESYTKEEEYAGVYDSTIKFKEYVPVGIRTTDIPYVARPGKIPVQPQTETAKGSLPSSRFYDDLQKSISENWPVSEDKIKEFAKQNGYETPGDFQFGQTIDPTQALRYGYSLNTWGKATETLEKSIKGKNYYAKGGGGMKHEEK